MYLFVKNCFGIMFFWAVVYGGLLLAILKGC